MTSKTSTKSPTRAEKVAAADADQYFTKPEVAKACLERLEKMLGGLVDKKTWWVEPSAGSGSFLNLLREKNKSAWGGDLWPQHSDVQQHDYLESELPKAPKGSTKTIVVGNPPFGKKAKLAVRFINQALRHGGMVAFIVPVQLRKWSAQKHIQEGARLIINDDLAEDSFLFLGQSYSLRCCLQVWTTWSEETLPGENLRLKEAPKTTHPDFEAWQFNCTPEAMKYFSYDWDFAVLRQGYGNFDQLRLPSEKDDLDTRKQWIFVKAGSAKALKILKTINYTALAKRNAATPGFGKADLVHAYLQLKAKQAT